jgi:hypothetical protein
MEVPMAERADDPTATRTGDPTAARSAQPTRCVCGEELVRINLLIDGEAITMCSCSHCDRRSWMRGNEEIELDGVLHDLSSLPTRYRRNLASR